MTNQAKAKLDKNDAPKQITVRFDHLKDTPNKRRFAETGDPSTHIVGSLYLTKEVSAKLGDPNSVKMVLSV